VIALSRRAGEIAGVETRVCDLFALDEVAVALAGADVAVYLVHSMLPSARLVQGGFADLDLLLADTFARAAERAGVGRIVYVGGLVPADGPLSPHLASRREVEQALASRGAVLAALRCGIVVGAGSSSLWILANLVRRLPAMILPRWTESSSRPIALADLVRAVRAALDEPALAGAFDLGGPDRMSYREMIARTARFLGRRRLLLRVPLFTPRLSRLWVQLFGSAPRALVGPLVDSLRHEMAVADNPLQRRIEPAALGFEAALAAALGQGGRPLPPPSSIRLEARRAGACAASAACARCSACRCRAGATRAGPRKRTCASCRASCGHGSASTPTPRAALASSSRARASACSRSSRRRGASATGSSSRSPAARCSRVRTARPGASSCARRSAGACCSRRSTTTGPRCPGPSTTRRRRACTWR
jgi:uncharacterized protein YbjT (DUF2867 family)